MTDLAVPDGRLGSSGDELLPVESMFEFFGARVRVMAQDVDLIRYWDMVYADFRTHPDPPDITVRVFDTVASDAPRSATIERDGQVRVWDGRGHLVPPLGEPPLTRLGYLQAAAVGRAGHVALLVGGPRTGKTTLALASVQRGASLLADDIVPIDTSDALALSFRKALRVRPDTLRLLDISPAHPGLVPRRTRVHELEYRVAPEAIAGRHVLDGAADVAAVLFVDLASNGSKPVLEPMPAREAFELLVLHLWERPRDGVAVTGTLIKLCQRAPCFRLAIGDPQQTAALVDGLLL